MLLPFPVQIYLIQGYSNSCKHEIANKLFQYESKFEGQVK